MTKESLYILREGGVFQNGELVSLDSSSIQLPILTNFYEFCENSSPIYNTNKFPVRQICMQKNIILRELDDTNQPVDFLVETQKDLNDLVDAINDLHNHDLSGYRTAIELEILSPADKRLVILGCLTGFIPNNFSRISFRGFKLDAYLKGVEFSGALQFHSVSFGTKIRVLGSRIGSLSFGSIRSSNWFSFGMWDSCEIGELLLSGNYGLGYEEIGRFGEFVINDNALKEVTISNIQANRIDLERNQIQTMKLRNLDVEDFSCSGEHNLGLLQVENCIFPSTAKLSSISTRALTIMGASVKHLSFMNVFGHGISLERIGNPSPDTGNSIKFSYLLPSIEASNSFEYDTRLIFSDISDVSRIDIASIQTPLEKRKPLSIKFQRVRFQKSEESHYYLGDFRLASLEFENCMNVSDFLELNNLDIDKLRIENTHMGKIMLNTINIRERLYLQAPIFNDAIFNDVNFENIKYKVFLIHPSGDQKRDAKTKKDYYRQLKFVMDKNGNFTEANHFFAKEMKEYSKTLVHGSDRLIYFTQKAVSDFGNSWQRPLYFLIGIGLIKAFFLDTQSPSIEPSSNAIRELYLYVYSLLNDTAQNINPFDGTLLNNELTVMSLLYRVVIAYLIYNFIISLKRLARR